MRTGGNPVCSYEHMCAERLADVNSCYGICIWYKSIARIVPGYCAEDDVSASVGL